MRKQKLTIIVLLVALVASLALNVRLGLWLREVYGRQLLHQIWPAGVPIQGPTNSPARSATPMILILGDSRVAEWPGPLLKGARVFNAGVNGQTSAELLLQCRSVLEQARPQIAVIQIGINDLKAIGVYPELRGAIVAGCVSNMLAVVEECRRQNTRVLVTAIWPVGPVGGMRRWVWNQSVAGAVAETNRALEQSLAHWPNARWIDLFSQFSANPPPGGVASLYRDTLHLKLSAYASLLPALNRALDPWLSGEP